MMEALRSALGMNGEAKPSPAAAEPRSRLVVPQPEPAIMADELFQAELRASFIKTLPDTLVALRASVKALAKADSESARADHAQALYRRIHTVTSNANLAGLVVIAQLGEALDALFKELYEKPVTINASTLRTLATAVDFLGYLFNRVASPERQSPAKPSILVVDDEAISRRAITHALERAKLKSTSIEDPNVAFKLLTESSYDLIFLDVDMPGMNGFELCTKIRALPRYKFTPIVFVTSLNDFECRTSSMMSGGNDFIAKPFHFLELAVKALVYVLRSKYPAQKKT
jgi:CheY-like chemotaxis protein